MYIFGIDVDIEDNLDVTVNFFVGQDLKLHFIVGRGG